MQQIESKEVDGPDNCKTNTRQEIDAAEKHYTNTDGSKFKTEDKTTVNDNNNNSITYFIPDPNSDVNKKASDKISQQLQREFKDVFNGVECFDGTFSLQVKPDSKPYQVPQRHIA